MSFTGLYINLDRSTERRAKIEGELARVGLADRFRRLRGVDGNEPGIVSPLKNPGEIGCFLSHVEALKQGMQANQPLHVIEDDTLLASRTQQILDGIISAGALEQFDILFTDVAMPLSNDIYRKLKSHFDAAVKRDASGGIERVDFQMLGLKDFAFTCTSSYLIGPKAFAKIMRLYQEEIAHGLRVPIDTFFLAQSQVGALRAGCLFPFVTSIEVEETLHSTVRLTPDTTRRFTATNIGRYSFFVDCDWNKCERLMRAHIPPPAPDRHAELLARLLAFSITEPKR